MMNKIEVLMKSMFNKKWKDYLNVLLVWVTVTVGIIMNFNVSKIAIIVVLIYFVANPLPSKLLAKLTIGALLIIPVSIIYGRSEITEYTSIAIYLFLVAMACMLFAESFFNKKERDSK